LSRFYHGTLHYNNIILYLSKCSCFDCKKQRFFRPKSFITALSKGT
jgi:hypothetical protein